MVRNLLMASAGMVALGIAAWLATAMAIDFYRWWDLASLAGRLADSVEWLDKLSATRPNELIGGRSITECLESLETGLPAMQRDANQIAARAVMLAVVLVTHLITAWPAITSTYMVVIFDKVMAWFSPAISSEVIYRTWFRKVAWGLSWILVRAAKVWLWMTLVQIPGGSTDWEAIATIVEPLYNAWSGLQVSARALASIALLFIILAYLFFRIWSHDLPYKLTIGLATALLRSTRVIFLIAKDSGAEIGANDDGAGRPYSHAMRVTSEASQAWSEFGFFLPRSAKAKILEPALADHRPDFFAEFAVAKGRQRRVSIFLKFTGTAAVTVFLCAWVALRSRLRDEFVWVAGRLNRD